MKRERQLAVAVQALQDIIDPIGKLIREMPEGHRLEGTAAYDWAQTAGPEIAKKALRKMGRTPSQRIKGTK